MLAEAIQFIRRIPLCGAFSNGEGWKVTIVSVKVCPVPEEAGVCFCIEHFGLTKSRQNCPDMHITWLSRYWQEAADWARCRSDNGLYPQHDRSGRAVDPQYVKYGWLRSRVIPLWKVLSFRDLVSVAIWICSATCCASCQEFRNQVLGTHLANVAEIVLRL